MVVKTKIAAKMRTAASASRTTAADVIVVSPAPPPARALAAAAARLTPKQARLAREADAEDVIDLGAPRLPRRQQPASQPPRPCASYTPNPRLYPGPATKAKRRRSEHASGETHRRRRKRAFLRPVPNSRLYRPAPRRPVPPPAAPRAAWPPPPPTAPLDTASRVALRLAEQLRSASPPPALGSAPARRGPRSQRHAPPPVRRGPTSPRRGPRSPRHGAPRPQASSAPPQLLAAAPPDPTGRRLVVTLPSLPAGEQPRRYRPASEHFRLRSLDVVSGESTPPPAAGLRPRDRDSAMEAGNRHSISPEDCSESNETLSAPSEFLAEFLSAIMRRQYAEALKFCRLILQYEPHNATARGFYPLLQHKVQGMPIEGVECRGSSSEEASTAAAAGAAPRVVQEVMEQGGDESECSEVECHESRSASRSGSRGSVGSQSSLELDSSEPLAHSSPSLSFSRRTEHSDSAASGGCWESSGSASRSEPDDNGNAPPPPALHLAPGDFENDNASGSGEPLRAPAPHLKSEAAAARAAASLQRLRAQFTCSIK